VIVNKKRTHDHRSESSATRECVLPSVNVEDVKYAEKKATTLESSISNGQQGDLLGRSVAKKDAPVSLETSPSRASCDENLNFQKHEKMALFFFPCGAQNTRKTSLSPFMAASRTTLVVLCSV
jgi:hypothetical protein